MTSSSRSSAPDALSRLCLAALAAASLAISGCGPKDGSSQYADASSAFASRDYRRAASLFAKSLELSPANVDSLVMLARSNLALGEIAEAAKAVGEAYELAGGDSDVLDLYGQVAYHAKKYDVARAAYAKLAGKGAADAVRSRGLCGMAVVDMAGIIGSGASAEERAATARAELLESVRLDARNACARYHLGRLYRDAFGYTEAALDQFEIYVRLETQAVDRVQSVQRKIIPELRDTIARATAQRPGVDRRDSAASASALKKAEEAWRKGTFKTAKLRYNDAYAADVLSYPAALGLAKSWEKTDPSNAGLGEALKYYKIASQLRPSSRDTLMLVGDLAAKLGKHTTAVEAYSRAVAARPGDISAIDGLIRALRKCGRPATAAVYQKYREGLPSARR